MKLTLNQILKPIIEFWGKLSKRTKIIGTASAGGIAVLAIAAAIILNNGNYVVLYRGLSSDEAGKIAARISEMNINPKIEMGGTILVPKEYENQLKMDLALEGYPQSAPNYDIFSDNSGFMATDYEKKKYLIFQLQNRLQDAIKTIGSIKNAIVTISLPEENSFVLKEDQVPATASVVLDIENNITLTPQQIKGIEELVAKSVPGLSSENVAIVDSLGNMLNNKYSDDSEGISYTKIDLEKNISQTMESRLMKLFQPMFGANSIRIAVNTSVDINKSVSESTTYSPIKEESGLVSQQQISRESMGGTGGAGGVPGTGSNTGVATYPQTNTEGGKGSSSESSSTNYLVNELKEQVERNGYKIADMSVAVLIGNKNITEEQIAEYKEMVSVASGVDLDKIVIANAEFANNNADTTEQVQSFFAKNKRLLIAAAAALFVIILALIIFILIRKKRRKEQEEDAEFEAKMGGLDGMFGDRKPAKEPLPGIVLKEDVQNNHKRQIQELASTNPDIVAQLLRTWIREEEDRFGD